MLAPTDAALGKAVVTNEAVPDSVRESLNVESGLNDGLAFPFVHLAIAWTLHEQLAAGWLAEWFAVKVLWKILAGVAVGSGFHGKFSAVPPSVDAVASLRLISIPLR